MSGECLSSPYLIWATSATTVIACGVLFFMWNSFSRRQRNKRRNGPHISESHFCHDSIQDQRPYQGGFQLSHRKDDIDPVQHAQRFSIDDQTTRQNIRNYQSSVLYPTSVPSDSLPPRREDLLSRTNLSQISLEDHLNVSRDPNLNNLDTSISWRESGETPNNLATCSSSFRYGAMYAVSERSNMQTVGGKLIVSVARNVTSRGDCLVLDDMGISLSIPPDAVPEGEEKLVCLVLNWDLSDNPRMSESDSLVSPVVFVGPHGIKLNKPCELRYRHCAYDPRHIVVMRSETDLHGDKAWIEMYGQENEENNCILSPDECRLKINTFTLYTCIQRPLRNLKMAKWLQIAAFSNPLEKRIDHHEVRVYFLNKTPCALQWAIQNEAHFQHVLMCPEKAFLFHGQVEDILDIRVTLKYLSSEWESIENDEYERVPYLHIWHGQCPHICMCFKKKTQYSVRELNFHLNVYQETLENEGEKIVVHATEESKRVIDNTCIINISTSQNENKSLPNIEVNRTEEQVNVSVNPNQCCSVSFLEEVCKGSRQYIPYDIRNQLKIKLDPHNPLGNDWRRLAEILDMAQCIEYLGSIRSSPTEVLLCVVEHRNMTLEELAIVLKKIKRHDAERIVQQFISRQTQLESTESCVRGGHQHDERRVADFAYQNNAYSNPN